MTKAIVGLLALFVALLIFGLSRFPDAPLRAHGNTFVGRTSVAHSAAEFAVYRVWERSFVVVSLVTTTVAIVGYVRSRRGESARSPHLLA